MRSACVFDWDGTLRRGITALDWMEFLGPILPRAQAASAEMRELLEDYRSGDVNYRYLVHKAAELYARCVAGAEVAEVVHQAQKFAELDKNNLFGFAQNLLQTAHTGAHSIIIVSGAPVEVIDAYRHVIPIDQIFALIVERNEDRFTNKIITNYGLMGKKREAIDELISEGYRITLAAGNSTSDLPLLEHAEHGFLISDEQEIKGGVNASFVDTRQAERALTEALWNQQ